jgi:hypothetical protein
MRTAAKVAAAILVPVGLWGTWRSSPSHEAAAPTPVTFSTPSPTPSPNGPLARHRTTSFVLVPSVIGSDDGFAKYVLLRTHLRPGRIRLEPSVRPWGSVIAQSVAPGSSVRAWTRVDLVLAKGSVPQPCRLYWCATFDRRIGNAPGGTRPR